MKVELLERKSAVLTPSGLACLADIPTINLTAGCGHHCIYCYTQGYRSTPRNGTIHLYANTASQLVEELQRKRRLPQAVYFSPSSDLFQPASEILDLAAEVLGILFEWGIGVSFLTKGWIPPQHMDLLTSNASLVQAQIGLISLDQQIAEVFEPHASSPQVRLDQAQELVEAGIATTGRLDPILPGLTDDETSLRDVCSGFAESGVTAVAASILFLRPPIIGSLRKNLHDVSVRTKLFDAYAEASRLAIHAENSYVTVLPQGARRAIFERLQAVAADFGISVWVCRCKNPDIGRDVCHIAGRASNTVESQTQGELFD